MSAGVWSYSGNPTSSDRDRLRFMIGDTDREDQLLSDQEIDYCLTTSSYINGAAVAACEAIAAKFARLADRALGPTQEKLSQKATAYERKATWFKRKMRSAYIPYAGGLSLAERDTDEADSDLVQPPIKRGFTDHP